MDHRKNVGPSKGEKWVIAVLALALGIIATLATFWMAYGFFHAVNA